MSPPYRIDRFLAYMKSHPVKDGRQRNGIELTELEQVVHTRLAEHHSKMVGRGFASGSSLMNIYFPLSGFQFSLLLIYFR